MELITPNILWLLTPLIIVVVFTLILVHWFLKQESRRQQHEFLMKNNQVVLQNKLQAFERFSLLLERITPEALVLREIQPQMTSFQLQNQLLKTVRAEFNHNLAMQIYVPQKTWEYIKRAREEVVRLINSTAAQIPPTVPAIELSRRIIEGAGGITTQRLKEALQSLNNNLEQIGIR